MIRGKGKGKGKGVRLRHMAQRFHEQSEDRNLFFSLSFLLSFFLALGITHHAIVERVK